MSSYDMASGPRESVYENKITPLAWTSLTFKCSWRRTLVLKVKMITVCGNGSCKALCNCFSLCDWPAVGKTWKNTDLANISERQTKTSLRRKKNRKGKNKYAERPPRGNCFHILIEILSLQSCKITKFEFVWAFSQTTVGSVPLQLQKIQI